MVTGKLMSKRITVFDVRGSMGHFRRPDTLGTHATYPFITRTAVRGLIASMLGMQELPVDTRCGLRLLSTICTVTQELSLHGKTWEAGQGAAASFSRPTSIELLVNPAYRVYYSGEFADSLHECLEQSRSHYHTYLGAAYCLAFPRSVGVCDAESINWKAEPRVETASVIPTSCVKQLDSQGNRQYARVGGLLYEHIGNRSFRGTINVLYEVNGEPICFKPNLDCDVEVDFVNTSSKECVCLW